MLLQSAPFPSPLKVGSELNLHKKLPVNSEFKIIEREESIKLVKDWIRNREKCVKSSSIDPRAVNAILAVQSAPGGGKTTFLNVLADSFARKRYFHSSSYLQ